jgi:2-polyprenyl-3-methyl-5-hydroxy-6-metoxy-1,4-benzoquinol methylase
VSQTEVDAASRALAGRIVQDIAGAGALRLCVIGDELGLFKELAEGGPATSTELAARTGLNERYLREWIYGSSAAGYLEFDKATRKASLPEAHVPVLAEECGPMFLGATLSMVHEILKPYAGVVDAFRKGGGVDYNAYDPSMWTNLERHSCVRYSNLLVQEWMPLLPEVAGRLEAGARFADFGCGAGGSTVELAKAYPNAQFVGYDLLDDNVRLAEQKAKRAGVEDRVSFRRFDFADGAPDRYDVIATFDVIHDMADPKAGLRTLRDAVADDGVYLLMDVVCEDDPADNEGPMAVFKFVASLHYCMTTAMANGGDGLGTCGFPEATVREYCTEAGFRSVRRVPIEHPLNALYVVEP